MSRWRAFARELRLRFGVGTPSVWVARLVLVGATQAALWSTGLAGNAPEPQWTLPVLAASLVHAWLPESHLGAAPLAGVVTWWGWSLRDGVHPAVLLATAALVAAHVAGVLLASGPARLRVDRGLTVRWCVRALAVLALAALTFGAAHVAARLPQTGLVWAAALAVLLVAVLLVRLATQPSDAIAES